MSLDRRSFIALVGAAPALVALSSRLADEIEQKTAPLASEPDTPDHRLSTATTLHVLTIAF